jgi:hypothetical protein
MLAMGHPILKTVTKDKLNVVTGTGATGPIVLSKKEQKRDTYIPPRAQTKTPIKSTGCNNYVTINGKQVPVMVKYEYGRITTYIPGEKGGWVRTEREDVRIQLQRQLISNSGRLCLDQVSFVCDGGTAEPRIDAYNLISQIPIILYDNKFTRASSVPLDKRTGRGHHAGTDIPTGKDKVVMKTDIRSKISQYFSICEVVHNDVTYILKAKTSDNRIVVVDMKHFEIKGTTYISKRPSGHHFHIAVFEYYNGRWELVDLSLVARIQRPKPK